MISAAAVFTQVMPDNILTLLRIMAKYSFFEAVKKKAWLKKCTNAQLLVLLSIKFKMLECHFYRKHLVNISQKAFNRVSTVSIFSENKIDNLS